MGLWRDWNFYGNLLFFVGSLLYVASSLFFYFPAYVDWGTHLNLAASLLFVVDALVYLAGWCSDRHVRLKHRAFRHLIDQV